MRSTESGRNLGNPIVQNAGTILNGEQKEMQSCEVTAPRPAPSHQRWFRRPRPLELMPARHRGLRINLDVAPRREQNRKPNHGTNMRVGLNTATAGQARTPLRSHLQRCRKRTQTGSHLCKGAGTRGRSAPRLRRTHHRRRRQHHRRPDPRRPPGCRQQLAALVRPGMQCGTPSTPGNKDRAVTM
jgi:hypothetical protein